MIELGGRNGVGKALIVENASSRQRLLRCPNAYIRAGTL